MQASTANTQHDRGSPGPQVSPELLETVARALAAALVPPPRQPAPPTYLHRAVTASGSAVGRKRDNAESAGI